MTNPTIFGHSYCIDINLGQFYHHYCYCYSIVIMLSLAYLAIIITIMIIVVIIIIAIMVIGYSSIRGGSRLYPLYPRMQLNSESKCFSYVYVICLSHYSLTTKVNHTKNQGAS